MIDTSSGVLQRSLFDNTNKNPAGKPHRLVHFLSQNWLSSFFREAMPLPTPHPSLISAAPPGPEPFPFLFFPPRHRLETAPTLSERRYRLPPADGTGPPSPAS